MPGTRFFVCGPALERWLPILLHAHPSLKRTNLTMRISQLVVEHFASQQKTSEQMKSTIIDLIGTLQTENSSSRLQEKDWEAISHCLVDTLKLCSMEPPTHLSMREGERA